MTASPDVTDATWVADRLAAGDTVASIGEQAGVSRQTASKWLKRHGLQAIGVGYQRPPVDQMRTDYELAGSVRALATQYEISPAVMHTWLLEAGVELSEPGRPRAEIDVDEVRRLRADGVEWGDIADKFGVSADTVRSRLTT